MGNKYKYVGLFTESCYQRHINCYMFVLPTVCRFFRSMELFRFPTKYRSALYTILFNDSGSRSQACITGTMASAYINNELCGTCTISFLSIAHKQTADRIWGMRNNDNSFCFSVLSNRTLSPHTKPAVAGIHGDSRGGRNWKLRRRHIPYLANITIVARKAVDNATFSSKDITTRIGLQLKVVHVK